MNKTINIIRVAIVLTLFGITWFLLKSTSAVVPVAIKKPLSSFPQVVGNYRLSDSFQSSADVIELLGVNDYIQYNYVADSGDRINLYVGYYRAVGVDGGYHSPKNCIPGGGWGIDTAKTVDLNAGTEGRKTSSVSQMLIRNGAQYQVVLYWYQNRGRIIASEYWEKIFQVVDAIALGRRDGTFVRIMANAGDGARIPTTEKQVRHFAEKVMPLLEEYLPGANL